MSHESTTVYEDGGILCDDQGLTIRRYYPWGAKRIPYTLIRDVEKLPLTGANKIRRWRIWGSGDFVHWWNLDAHRPEKDLALVIAPRRRSRTAGSTSRRPSTAPGSSLGT
jgi:hypothetical protein